jgi:hypothetical protein
MSTMGVKEEQVTDLERQWTSRTDEQLAEAAHSLGDYTTQAQCLIRAELERRGMEVPVVHEAPLTDTNCLSPSSENTEFESLEKSKEWFVAAQTMSGDRRLLDREHFISALRTGILDGTFSAASTIEIHSKGSDGKWKKTTSYLGEFAKAHFKLRVLYQPVWAHAIAGLKWGAIIGSGLKLLDTLVLLGSADPALAFMFLVAIGVCFIPRLGMLAIIAVSVAMSRFSRANFFVIALSAASVGAVLGCFPGMAIGGIVGLSRRRALPAVRNAAAEPVGQLLKAILLPIALGVVVWLFYLLVFHPWLTRVMEK